MYDHVNYATEGPGAARGLIVLRGEVIEVDVDKSVVTVRVMGANHYQNVKFYEELTQFPWKVGQAVEMTIASFDA